MRGQVLARAVKRLRSRGNMTKWRKKTFWQSRILDIFWYLRRIVGRPACWLERTPDANLITLQWFWKSRRIRKVIKIKRTCCSLLATEAYPWRAGTTSENTLGKIWIMKRLNLDNLDFERNDSTCIMIKLEAFLTEVIGTKYGLNPLDLVITKDDHVVGHNGHHRTFFCSQLVAQCLK